MPERCSATQQPEAESAPAGPGPVLPAGPHAAALQLARAAGNRGFAQALTSPGGSNLLLRAVAPPNWEDTPNLVGEPPTRSRLTPPNTGIVEDAATYQNLYAATGDAMQVQQDRAAGFLTPDGRSIRDFRWFFAHVYSRVTNYEREFAANGTYFYPSYVLRCVLQFEKIYADNVAAWDARQGGDQSANVEDHWRIAFERGASAQQRVEAAADLLRNPGDPEAAGGAALNYMITSVLASVTALTEAMKAHIRFDLPRAEAWVFNDHYAGMEDATMRDFMPDFMSMAGVFDNAAREMQTEMAEKLGLPLDLMPTLLQDTAMRRLFDADMATERADTWQRAEELQASGTAGTGPYTEGADGSLTGDVTRRDNLSILQGFADPSLNPTMDASFGAQQETAWWDFSGDDQIRAVLAGKTDADIAAAPMGKRVQWIRGLFQGATLDDDEQCILRILRSASGAELNTLLDAVDAWDMMYALDGAEATSLRSLLNPAYYAQTSFESAWRLVRKCMDGETAEWEEQMIADILVARAGGDGRSMVERVGSTYPGDEGSTYADGYDYLLGQLDWSDEDRFEAAYAVP